MPQKPQLRSGNISFNAQHSPVGAFASFTCGHFESAGGIGIERGKPGEQNLYIGVKRGARKTPGPVHCLPFFKRNAPALAAASPSNFQGEGAPPPAPAGRSYEVYPTNQISRSYGWATDTWITPDFTFSIYTPFGEIPAPTNDGASLRNRLLPAVIAKLEVDNTRGSETKTAVFAIDFVEPGSRLLDVQVQQSGTRALGFAWRRSMGVLADVQGAQPGELFAIQRWSVAEALTDVNPIHALGNVGGVGIEVPAGEKRTINIAIGVHLDGLVTTGLEGRYYYTRFYASLEEVLLTALQRAQDLQAESARLDAELLQSGLSEDQQFLLAHATRSYYGSTQLLDVGGEPFWIVNEGEYCMMNTLDLSVDHVFWELQQNPWVVENILTRFVRHYSYHDGVKGRGGQHAPGGISFCHDMGVNNNFSPAGYSSYELENLNGCFSYMTQEQLCNWILTAACYVAKTGDTQFAQIHGHLLLACEQSMRARANARGLMVLDSDRCGKGQEITTYDSLDESLGQARSNTYLATKCWATWLALEFLAMVRGGDEVSPTSETSLAGELEEFLSQSAVNKTLPAVLEKDNPGYHSRILPVIEALVYPAYWLQCLANWPRQRAADIQRMLQSHMSGPFIDMLADHAVSLLTDPQRRNLFGDGGIKLSSTSNNSWMSKIAIVQFVARAVLRLQDRIPDLARIMSSADAAHLHWQIDGGGYWACSDQFISGEAKASRYYPRIVTAFLWVNESKTPAALTPHRSPLQDQRR